MRSSTCLFSFLLASAFASLLPAAALAQAPRAGRVISGPASQPAIFLGRDRAWTVGSDADALPAALCSALMCRPVVRAESCTAPRCPGSGRLVFTNEAISEVADWPQDREGFGAAQTALYAEPELAPLTPYFVAHPEPPPSPPRPARFSYDRSDWWHLEYTTAAGIASGWAHVSAPMFQLDVVVGLRFRPAERLGDGLDIIYGNQMGFELRAHILGNVTGQRGDDLAIFLGLGPGFAYVEYDDVFRVPAFFSSLIPEFGFVVRTDRVPVAWYLGWSLPVTVLVEEHLGVEARASVLLIDDWYPGDDAEVIGSLTVGVHLR